MSQPIQPKPLLLASASPRRAELLRGAGYQFDVIPPLLEEPDNVRPHVAPGPYAESLAYFKASSVAEQHPGKTILAADTIAFLDGLIIGKPTDRRDARRILKLLSGTTHEVISGLALLGLGGSRRFLEHEASRIRVRPLTDEAIEAYLDTGAWRGKAGAYGIQDHGDAFVTEVRGSFTNVVGLPMELLARMFRWYESQED